MEARAAARAAEARTQTLLDGEREIAGLREEFIAVLGHDLRNPLASISGGLNLLKRNMPPERRALIMEMLEGSVIRMGGLIDNVLDFARGRLGAGIPLDLRTGIVLKPILEQVVSELHLGDHDRIIETDFSLAAPIKCDPSRIGQLLSNLLGNALTHGVAGKPVRVHADQKEGMLTIWVANAGEPIPAGTLERLSPSFSGARAEAAGKALVSACTSPPRSPRLMAARSASRRTLKKPASRSGCRSSPNRGDDFQHGSRPYNAAAVATAAASTITARNLPRTPSLNP